MTSAVRPNVVNNPDVDPVELMRISPSSCVDPSAVAWLSANKHSLLSITAEYTPTMLAVLIAPLSPWMVLLLAVGTATDVPLITMVSLAVRVVVTALEPCTAG